MLLRWTHDQPSYMAVTLSYLTCRLGRSSWGQESCRPGWAAAQQGVRLQPRRWGLAGMGPALRVLSVYVREWRVSDACTSAGCAGGMSG